MRSNGSAAGNEALATFARLTREYEANQLEWARTLMRQGIKAAHPDDGWVDRKKNTFVLMYPEFRSDISVGSLVALGNHEKYRLVRVTGEVDSLFKGFGLEPRYTFEEAS